MFVNQHGAIGFRSGFAGDVASVEEQRGVSGFREQSCQIVQLFKGIHRAKTPSSEGEAGRGGGRNRRWWCCRGRSNTRRSS
jgi:hypothetical protein